MTQQFSVFAISAKSRKAIRDLGGKVSRIAEVTFPQGTLVEVGQGRSCDGFRQVERTTYTIPGGTVLVHHAELGLYVDKFVGISEGR